MEMLHKTELLEQSEEIWTFVRDWESRYQISSYGRIWSTRNHKEIKPYNNGGYLYVTLCRDTEERQVSVHRLVAENFLSEKGLGDLVVHHIDENKTNNHIDNLAIMTASAHASLHKIGKPSGKKKALNIFKADTGEFVKTAESMIEAARFVYDDENAGPSKAGAISRAIKNNYTVRGFRFELI